jgi:hypothetical protein
MQSNITIDKFLGDNLAKTAYQLLQQSKSVFSLAHKDLSDRLRQLMTPSHNSKIQSLTPEILDKLKGEYDRILETDWQEAQEGIYPVSLLFETARLFGLLSRSLARFTANLAKETKTNISTIFTGD